MKDKLVTVAIALVIPVAAFVLVSLAEAHLESEWLKEVEAQFGPQPQEVRSQIRLSVLCSDSTVSAELGSACDDTRLAATLRSGAIGGAALGGAMLLAFVPITVLGRRNRTALALIFRPAMVAVLALLAVLVLVNGALLMGTVWLVEGAFTGGVHIWIIGAVGVTVAVAAYGVLRAIVGMTRRQPQKVSGIALDRDSDPELFDLVDDVASQVGTRPPSNILAGLDPTFFVTEADVQGLDGEHRGRTLFVSAPLCRILSRSEVSAVIGHELGHFLGEDTKFSTRFYPVYRGATESLLTLQATAGGLATIAMIPPIRILATFFEAFASAERRISRDRELAADRVGASVASPVDLASSLVKLNAHSSAWTEVLNGVVRSVRDGIPVGNVSERYAERALLGARASHVSNLDEGRIPHPFDSHPVLRDRLASLDVSVDSIVGQASITRPTDRALDLLGEPEELEIELSERLEEEIARQAGLSPDRTEAVDRTASLRSAAETDPAVAAAIALFERVRGPHLGRPFQPNETWRTIAPLERAPHPDPHSFASMIPVEALPAGDQVLVVGVATAATPRERRIEAGVDLRPVGFNSAEERRAGREEDYYLMNDVLVVVRGVGDWPVKHQLAGLFVVPVSDPLVGPDSVLASELAAVVEALVERRPATLEQETGAEGPASQPMPVSEPEVEPGTP